MSSTPAPRDITSHMSSSALLAAQLSGERTPATSSSAVPEVAQESGQMEELVELQLVEEVRLEKLFWEQKAQRGLDEVTLDTFFKLFDMWIQLYRLNKCREVLEEVVPVCEAKGGNWHIKAIQALAFTVWKQSNFALAAELFQKIEALVGPSAALCENMGHTYSSLGNYPKASEYFRMGLEILNQEDQSGRTVGDRAGMLLGLGLIEDRQGHHQEALTAVQESQDLYRARANGKPSSLIAKAGMSVAKILLKIAASESDAAKKRSMEEEAVRLGEENVAIFEVTCGADSPLTASALKGLGEAYKRRGRREDAIKAYAKAYLLEALKDSFDLVSVMEVHNELFDAHLAQITAGVGIDRKAFKSYLSTVEKVLARVKLMPQDANAGAYYKAAGEFMAFAEDYAGADMLLTEAIRLFKAERHDKEELVGRLIVTCQELKDFCTKQLAAACAGGSSGSSSSRGSRKKKGGR